MYTLLMCHSIKLIYFEIIISYKLEQYDNMYSKYQLLLNKMKPNLKFT